MKPNQSNKIILASLSPWRLRIFFTYLAAVLLGLAAAVLGVIIGPTLQVLLSESTHSVEWSFLVGPFWSPYLARWTATSELLVADIYMNLPWILLSVASVKAVLTFWQWYSWEWLGEQVAFAWRRDLVAAFSKLKPTERDGMDVSRGEENLGGLISQDIRTCRDYVVHYFGGLPREGFQVLFMAVTLVSLSPKLFAIFIFLVAPIGAILNRLGRRLRRRATKALEDNSFVGEWIQQRLLGLETIKHYRTEASEMKAMHKLSLDLFKGYLRAASIKARTSPLIECIGIMAMAAALCAAFYDIAEGKISGAVAMSFFSSLALFAQSASKLGRYFNSNREGLAAADRIFSTIADFQSKAQDNIRPAHGVSECDQTSLTLKNVFITYGDKIAVNNLSYTFSPGKIYCIVGSSGAGKSSLFNGILGLRDLKAGKIIFKIGPLFANRSLDIAYLPQQVPTVPCKLGENVSYPVLTFDSEKVRYALEQVGFSIEASRLPNGFDTMVGTGGLQLSGGQLQRLQLARIIYHHAPFVLIDEGTSALDPEIEKLVLSHLQKLAISGNIIIMIAHRMSAVEMSDEVLVLENAQLIASGQTQEVKKNPAFQRIFVATP